MIEASKGNEKGSVSIFDALVVAMKRYESTFTRFSTSQQEEVSEKTIHYMLQLDDGLVASDTKKRTPRTPFSGVLVRLSEPAAAGVNVGDRITFNGKLDNDSFWSHMIKNVKKVSTSPGTGDQP